VTDFGLSDILTCFS